MTQDSWRSQGIHSPDDRRFVGLAAAAIDDYQARNPVAASLSGDTRFDARLPDYSRDGIAEQVRVLNRHLLALDSIDPVGLSRANAVDLGILRRNLALRVHRLRTLDEPLWNPLWWSPALALEPLLARPEPPVQAILARLDALPDHLDVARSTLRTMSAAHLDLALQEVAATPAWLSASLTALPPAEAAHLQPAAAKAAAALAEYRHWLATQRPLADHDPRLGPRRYEEVWDLVLGPGMSYQDVQREAEQELAELGEQLRSLASRSLGRSLATRRLVPTALAAVADRYTLQADELVPAARRSLAAARAFVVEQDLVTVPDFAVEVVGMPSVRAGRAAAFSEMRGGPGMAGAPARIAVTGPEPRWAPTRRASFLREYNALMLDALLCHQAIPGHALGNAHAQAAAAPTAVRAVFPDLVFAEGWAMHAQSLMSRHEYPGSVPGGDVDAFALQELKLRMRGVANALLDIGFHTGELDEPQARRLLATAAMAEEGEFVVKWRKVRTTAAILSAYFVGHRTVSQIVDDVAASTRGISTRRAHDRVLMHGAVPPSGLRDLLGLD